MIFMPFIEEFWDIRFVEDSLEYLFTYDFWDYLIKYEFELEKSSINTTDIDFDSFVTYLLII